MRCGWTGRSHWRCVPTAVLRRIRWWVRSWWRVKRSWAKPSIRVRERLHAEPLAIELARRVIAPTTAPRPDLTLYVNLEPCAHQGRTPPCTAAILAAGIPRVVVAIQDPDTRVAGRGIETLRAHDVRVEVGCRAGAARELNHIFLRRQERGPAVRRTQGGADE